jgi:hypothetical protein
MALRQEELEDLIAVSRKLRQIRTQNQVQTVDESDRELVPEGFIAGIKREVQLTNGVIRKFRFDSLLRLRWVSDSDGSYIRPDVNGEWMRKTPTQKYRLKDLQVDNIGNLTYSRTIDSNVIHFVEKLDLSCVGTDSHGRVARIGYPDGSFRAFEYNRFNQISKYTATDGSIWNANDELLWRQWPTCRQDVHAVMEVGEDGIFIFVRLNAGRGEEQQVVICRADGSYVNEISTLEILSEMLEIKFEELPLNEDETISADSLYKTLRDLPVSGPVRVAAAILWDYARRNNLKSVSKDDISKIIENESYAKSLPLLVSRAIHLRNIFRQEDNADIKRIGRYKQLRLVLAGK